MKLRLLICLGLAMCLGALARAQLVLQNTTYSSGNNGTIPGPNTIATANNVIVNSGASVTFQASTGILLGPGFHAQKGSVFRAIIMGDPSLTVTPSLPGALTFGGSSPVTLSFAVNDANGTVVKVEIYRNGVLVSTLTSPTSGSTWTYTDDSAIPLGTYHYEARAYDSSGGITNSAPVTATVNASVPSLASLPYLADFESSEGYLLGSLNQQLDWSVSQGSALVTNQDAYSGSQSVVLQPSTPPAQITQTFAPLAGQSIIFVDFYAKPVAAAFNTTGGTIFNIGGASFSFELTSPGLGFLCTEQPGTNSLDSGPGIGTPPLIGITSTNFTVPLAANNQSQNWIRLTVRLDFVHQTWDIYANGVMVAADLNLFGTNTALTNFSVQGDTATASEVDDILAGPDNPLFADFNNDGIDDAWETGNGLSLSVNDRYLFLDINGSDLTVLQQFINSANQNTPQALAVGFVLFSPSP